MNIKDYGIYKINKMGKNKQQQEFILKFHV